MNVLLKCLLGSVLLSFAGLAHAQDVNGTLRVVKGDVQIKSGKTGQSVRARIGEKVYPKDVIITGKDARAKIVMVDNNEINVSPESQIEIQHYEFDPSQGKKDVLLNVIYGKVRAKVEQHYDGKTSNFQVKTPAAVAGVRGTDFMTSYDRASGNSQVVTFRGAVEFGLPGPGGTIHNAVSVTPGKMASSSGGLAPHAPTSMPKEQLAKMDHESRAEGPVIPGSKNGPAPASEKSGNGNGSSNANGNGNSASNGNSGPSSDGSRAPASTGGSPASTLTGQDMPSGNPPPPAVAGPTAPPMIPTPAPVPVNNLPQCSVCNQFIQGGNTKLTVQVK